MQECMSIGEGRVQKEFYFSFTYGNIQIYICILKSIDLYAYVMSSVCVCVCVCVDTYICVHAYVCMFLYVCIYVSVFVYIHRLIDR